MAHRCEHLCSASQLWLPHPALCIVPPECFQGLHVWSRAMGSKSGKLQYVADHDTTSLPPITMLSLKDQVTLLMQQIQVLQNQLSAWCRQENGSMHIPPMETSFGHWNMLILSQDENPIIGRIFAGNTNIQFFRCLPNRDVISSLNPPNSHDPNGGTYIWIGRLLKKKRLFSGQLPN